MADNTIATGYIQIEPTTKGIKGQLESELSGDVESAGKSIGGKFGSAIGTAAKVGVAGVVAATGAVTAFGTASVEAGKTFDVSMSQVAATMGYSTEEINKVGSEANKTFTDLSNFAQQMGASTAFSASEAADALNYMALAGYDADTSMEVLPSVLDLAAAGGIGLADASDMVTDALSALGKGSDYASTLVDQMAKTSSKSNTSVQQLGEAMLTIGATGRQAAGGTKELATMLGVMADNGIKGTEGGTHLRNIMLSLGQHSDKIKELGVDVYDANGDLRDMTQIFTEMSVAMKDMTEQEKTDFLTSEMFNKTDLAAVNALIGTQASRYKELGAEIANSNNAATDMANTQLDNLAGDITLFQSALEGVQIQVSSMLTPAIRDFVGLASDGLGEIASALQNGDVEGAFSHLGDYLGAMFNTFSEKLPAIVEGAEKLLSAFGQALLDNLPTLIQTALDIVTSLVQYLIEGAPALLEAALQIVQQLALGLAEQAPTLIPQIVEMILTLVESFYENADMMIDAAIALVMGLAEGLINALPILIEKAPTIVMKLAGAIISNAPKLMSAPFVLIGTLAKGLLSALPQLVKVGGDLVSGIWNGIKNAWSKLVENAKQLASSLVSALKSFFRIGSPSKLMGDEIGQWLPKGITVGIEKNADSPIKALTAMSDDMTSTLQSQIASDVSMNSVYSNPNLEVASNDTQGLFDLMSQYLPQMANSSVNISLEGDAAGLFNAVRKQDNIFSKANGRSAFA